MSAKRQFDPLTRYEPDLNSGCWLWAGPMNNRGYGAVSVKGRSVLAHRFFYEALVRPFREGEVACHRCDTPACVNPNHIVAGTASDNQRDSIRKGRRGPSPELRRAVLSDPRTYREIAAAHQLAVSAVWRIKSNPSWLTEGG